MQFDNFLQHFQQVKGQGDSRTALCPGHDDNRNSLSINYKAGKILVCCHAGCDTAHVLSAVGLKFSDLQNGTGNHSGRQDNARRRIVATYDYTDAHGKLLYQAVRYEPKSFTQRCPDGKGGWEWSMKGVSKVLYRLPELLSAAHDQWIFVVEGEKDVDALRAIGLVATCNVGGAGKWISRYSESLKGKEVCILPDNDEPGRQHAHKVAKALQGVAAHVKVIELPSLPVKGDVSDWLASGGEAAQLLALVEATPDYVAPLPIEASGHANGKGAHTAETAKHSMSSMLLQALESLNMTFRLNQLEDNIEVNGSRLDDVISAQINLELVDKGFSRPNIADGVTVLAGRNSYHPIHDYLSELKWDGRNHLRRLMDHLVGDDITVTYDGATLPLYASLTGRWLTGAVARALVASTANPFRHQTPMLVIIGPQGIGKSSLIRWLASGVGYEFHRESMINPHSVEDMRSMVTKWIWEVSELGSSLRRGDRDALKAFITQEWHTYRKPWGKHPITKPTLCNLAGTLNRETGFLDDPTGHRRFLPVTINAIDHSYSNVIDVNQLWAQIVELYRSGKTTPELNQAERTALQSVYREHEVENPLATYISMYFDVESGNDIMRCHTATIIQRLQKFNIKLPTDPKVAGRWLNDVLEPLGLERSEFRIDGIKGRGWLGIQPNSIRTPNGG